MLNARNLFLCIALLAANITSAVAADRFTYEPKAFQAALDAGRPILVQVTAAWCAECKEQKPIVAALAEEPAYKDLTIFEVDFDTQKDALRQLRVQKESTLVIYKNKAEVARAVGITRRGAIEALMKKAL